MDIKILSGGFMKLELEPQDFILDEKKARQLMGLIQRKIFNLREAVRKEQNEKYQLPLDFYVTNGRR